MNKWLFEQFELHPNAVFSFIGSLDELDNNHKDIPPELYRWSLFDALFQRFIKYNKRADILTQDVIFGPEGYLSYTRTFYRSKHAPIINIVGTYLKEKYGAGWFCVWCGMVWGAWLFIFSSVLEKLITLFTIQKMSVTLLSLSIWNLHNLRNQRATFMPTDCTDDTDFFI